MFPRKWNPITSIVQVSNQFITCVCRVTGVPERAAARPARGRRQRAWLHGVEPPGQLRVVGEL